MSRRPRTPLSKERVLRAAMTLADQHGIDSLTMRTLARKLGVEAMSLYHYVAKKDDILDGIVELVLGEIEAPSPSTDWKTGIRRSAISAHDVLSRHPWACTLILTGKVRPARLRYMDALLASLREAGFSPELTYHAYHALDSHVMGFTLWAANFPGNEDLAAVASDFLRDFPAAEYPDLAEHIEQHMASSLDDVSEFEFVLDLILDGLDRARATR